MAKRPTALMVCAAAIVAALAGPAAAQVTPAQQDAVRANCRSDFLSLCRGVTPGGAEALGCLKQNAAKLAPACKQAVDAINLPGSRSALPERSTVGAAPSPEPAATAAPIREPGMQVAQLRPMQMRNLQMACSGDAQIFCVGVPRDPQARIACLRDNAANLSPPCQLALRSLAAAMPGGAPGAAAAPAATAGGQPSAEQQAAIRATCRSDAMSLCPGQQGQGALTCLQSNSARLSTACQTAVGAVGGAATAPATAAAPARSAVPAGAVAQAPPTAQQQSAIRSNCRSDAMSLCPGQQGQQAFTCLKSNSAQLSAACRTAISAVGGAPAAPAAAAAPATPRPAPAPAAAAPAAPAPVAAAPAAPPTQAQQDAIRANCRSDAISLCPGQQGQGAFVCLQSNSAKLSAACRTAVGAVGGPPTAAARPAVAPAGPAPAATAPTAAPAPAPTAAAAPSQSEAESMATLGRSCGGDIQSHCKGVSLGGGRLMACLAVNGEKLSPQCKQALTEVSQSR